MQPPMTDDVWGGGARLTLGALWRQYERECAAYLDNTTRTRREDAARATVLLASFGEPRDVRTLAARDQTAYTTRRRVGGIVLPSDEKHPDGFVTRAVRARSVEMDLVLLHGMLSWMQQLAADTESDLERTRWTKMELALVLAEATGRRLGPIRQLRWEDVDFDRQTIHWRAEFDKKSKEWIVPVTAALIEELKQFRKRLGAISGWMFPGERKPDQAMNRHLFDKWLVVAEQKAQLPRLAGGL
jgi:integrase